MLKTESREHPRGFAVLLPASIFGLHQVLPAYVQADEDPAAGIIGPHSDSKFFKKLLGFLPKFRKSVKYGP